MEPTGAAAGTLMAYQIFRRPIDMPDCPFVVRAFIISHAGSEPVPGGLVGTAGTLDEARALVPAMAGIMFPRADEDHETMVETWM